MKSFTLMALLGATQAATTTGTCASDGTGCTFALCNKEDAKTNKWSPHGFAKTTPAATATADQKAAFNACKNLITAEAYCKHNALDSDGKTQCKFEYCNKETAANSGKWEATYTAAGDAKTACADFVTAEAYCTRNKNDSDGKTRCTFDICNKETTTKSGKWEATYTATGDAKTACTNFVSPTAYCSNNKKDASGSNQCAWDTCNTAGAGTTKRTWSANTLAVKDKQCDDYTSAEAYCKNDSHSAEKCTTTVCDIQTSKATPPVASLKSTVTNGTSTDKYWATNCNAKFVNNPTWLCSKGYVSAKTDQTTLADVCTVDTCNTEGAHGSLTPHSWASGRTECKTFIPSLYRCEHGGPKNCDASDCFHKTTATKTAKSQLTWTTQPHSSTHDTSNMWTRCGTDCGYASAAANTDGINTPTAMTVDNSDWGTQTQCVNPSNADEQCHWLGKGCDFKTQCTGDNKARYVHSTSDIAQPSPVHPATAVTHAQWSDYYWQLRCNWTTEYASLVDQITDMAGWNTFVSHNAAQYKKYKADVATDSATTASATDKADKAANTNHEDKYDQFVQWDTITSSHPNPLAKHFLKWHAATLKAATTHADLEALRSADVALLSDATSNETAACKDATSWQCTEAKDRVTMVNGWVNADDAAIVAVNKKAAKLTIAKTETLKNEQAALTANQKKLTALQGDYSSGCKTTAEKASESCQYLESEINLLKSDIAVQEKWVKAHTSSDVGPIVGGVVGGVGGVALIGGGYWYYKKHHKPENFDDTFGIYEEML